MKIHEECLPCVVTQSIRVANLVGLENKDNLLKSVFRYLSEIDFLTVTAPEMFGEVFNIIKRETGNDDPYKETRKKYNQLLLGQLSSLEAEINAADNVFEEAVKYAIIGNIIDFGPSHNLTEEIVENQFSKSKTEPLEINETEKLLSDVKNAKTVLYIGDNCGEICLDKLLIKKIKEINPEGNIFFATRGTAILNDSIEEDAYFVGMDEYANIITNGNCALGTDVESASSEFRNAYETADVIISKGQANYESLSTSDKNIYFLLMTKCPIIAGDIGCANMKMLCMKKQIGEEK